MHAKIFAIFVSALVALSLAQSAAPSKDQKDDGRFLTSLSFSVFTVIKKTTTTTSTLTSTITCTTSTGTLSTCTAGRRRRGLFYSEKEPSNRRGLFYSDDELPENPVFKSNVVKRSDNPVDEVKEQKTPLNQNLIPLVIEPGFKLPAGTPVDRFLLAIGTATSTIFTVTTTTSSITAICSSVTGFPTCASGR